MKDSIILIYTSYNKKNDYKKLDLERLGVLGVV